MTSIPKTHPLSDNAHFVINRAFTLMTPETFREFVHNPTRFSLFLGECLRQLKKLNQFYFSTEERYTVILHQQIIEWAKLNREKIKNHLSANPAPAEEASTNNKHTHIVNYSNQPVATPTLVFGTDVADMNADQCIAAIQANNKSIKTYEETGITSPYISEKIAGLHAANEVLVKRLDGFATPTA